MGWAPLPRCRISVVTGWRGGSSRHVRDPGEGFSFEGLRHAAISNPDDAPAAHLQRRMELNMRAGGFGILVARNLVDELIYNERGNEVLLVKYLQN
jgi:anti-sigma regulatory factor (Ser/Thr protein kinase)